MRLYNQLARRIASRHEESMQGYRIGQAEFAAGTLAPGLHVVATPIGNLGDITLRALETLAGASIIACEDTRVTAKLLQRYAIDTPMTAYHEHNAARAGPKLLDRLKNGESVALVSDAGTPLVSDPGFRLVEAARSEGIDVWPVPGPSAALAALTASGLPSDCFLFDGFLPNKQVRRRKRLAELAQVPASLIFFESPNRLTAALEDMAGVFEPDRRVSVCRELTKMHEEVRTGEAAELAAHYGDHPPRGEIVIVVAPPAERSVAPEEAEALLRKLMTTQSPSRAAAMAAAETGLPRRELYQKALQLADEPPDGGR